MFLQVPLSSSRGLGWLLAVAGLFSLGRCWVLPPPWALGLSLIGLAYLVRVWRLSVSRVGSRSVVEVSVAADNEWSVRLVDGSVADHLRRLNDSFCHPLLVLLTLESVSGQRFSVIVPRDAAPVDSFRRLRVLLQSGD